MTTHSNIKPDPGKQSGDDRYARQICFAPLGADGQQQLAAGRALVCGCGALGSVIANTLVRAGVGMVRIVDRDFLEMNNLQRQVIFNEKDVTSGLPKAIAAAQNLATVNSQVTIEPVVEDVTYANIDTIAADVDVIVDGTDNFETRMLINDFAVKEAKPWIYGGCIGAEGQTMTILPGKTACLGCLMPELPPPGTTPTCDTAGILGPVVNVIASFEAMEAIKILSGNLEATNRQLMIFEMWHNRVRQLDTTKLFKTGTCLTCAKHKFRWLDGNLSSGSAVLCGRNSVQIGASAGGQVSFPQLAQKLASVGEVTHNRYLLRVTIAEHQLTVFADGRTIVAGTDDISTARTLVAKYIGS